MFTKNCPKCNSIISYSRKSNLNKSLKNNSVCKFCVERTDEHKNKISKARKQYLQNLSNEEKQIQINKMSNSLKQFWNNKSELQKEEWKKSVSFVSKERWKDEEFKNSLKNKIKKSWDCLTTDEKASRIEKSLNNGAGICLYYMEGEYRVYGNTEKRYIKYLIDNDKNLPIKKTRAAISTPFGLYFPDFEYETFFVEIKSEYTYSKLINRLSYDGKTVNKQLDKILWVCDSIKKVVVLVETKGGEFVERACTFPLS
jgi:hypothetical protein